MTLAFWRHRGAGGIVWVRCAVLGGLMVAVVCAASACGESVDIHKSLQLDDVVTGFYDAGVVNGKNKLVPSISFRVKNTAEVAISGTQFNAVFRVIGDEQELGSALVRGIGSEGLSTGAVSTPFVLRSTLGYTGEQPRAEMLQHKDFHDVQVEVFAKHRSNQWVKLGQYRIDRQLLTH